MVEKMYGLAIRLPVEDKGQHAMNAGRAILITERLVNTIDITIAEVAAKSSNYLIKPRLRLRLDPTRLLCDLIGDLIEQVAALDWINSSQNNMLFKKNEETAIHAALDRWCREDYSGVLNCDQSSVWITDESGKVLTPN